MTDEINKSGGSSEAPSFEEARAQGDVVTPACCGGGCHTPSFKEARMQGDVVTPGAPRPGLRVLPVDLPPARPTERRSTLVPVLGILVLLLLVGAYLSAAIAIIF